MPEDVGFREMIRRVREGSSDAAWELVDRYGPALRRVVRSKLNRRLRPQFDSLDFVQLVWSSFFRSPEKLERFDSPDEMVAFLVGMARNKVVTEVRRRLMTQRHNLNRERSLDAVGAFERLRIPDRQPSPLDVAIARERWRRLVSDQPDHYREIIRLRLQGYTYQAIADSLQINERTVRRVLQKLLEERAA